MDYCPIEAHKGRIQCAYGCKRSCWLESIETRLGKTLTEIKQQGLNPRDMTKLIGDELNDFGVS